MLGKEPFRIVIGAGVARFDAHDNLFVNLPHTDDDPQTARIGGPDGSKVPAPERRARVHGPGEPGTVSGAFPGSADLPRGLTIEVKGYESVTYTDGRLEISMPAGSTLPNWFTSGADHHFDRPGESVRLWVKSALPAGVSLADNDAAAPAPPPKPAARAQFQPKSEAAKPPPAAELTPEAPPAPDKEPYRPGRLPADHMKDRPETKGGLGCSTLLVTLAVTAAGLAALL